MKIFFWLAAFLAASETTDTFANDVPLSKHFGVGVSQAKISVKGPEGETNPVDVSFVSGMYIMPFNRNYPHTRLWSQFSYLNFDITPAPDIVGQSVESISIQSIFQYSFNVSHYFRPWLGAGIGIDIAEYKNRRYADEFGFESEALLDESGTSLNTVLNVGLGSRKLEGFFFNVNFFYSLPLGEGIQSQTIQLSILF